MLRLSSKTAKLLKHFSLLHVVKPSRSFSNVASLVDRAQSNGNCMEEKDQQWQNAVQILDSQSQAK